MIGSKKVYGAFYALAWFILAGMFTFAAAPFVETRMFPVYSKFHILEATQTPDGVVASFEFEKFRECEPKGLTWFLGEIGISTAVTTSAPEGTRGPRPLGRNVSSPYLLEGVTIDDLNTQVIAQLRNQCSIFGIQLPWTTISDVYP